MFYFVMQELGAILCKCIVGFSCSCVCSIIMRKCSGVSVGLHCRSLIYSFSHWIFNQLEIVLHFRWLKIWTFLCRTSLERTSRRVVQLMKIMKSNKTRSDCLNMSLMYTFYYAFLFKYLGHWNSELQQFMNEYVICTQLSSIGMVQGVTFVNYWW